MSILLSLLLLVVSFLLLIKGADYFVEGASNIAERFGIPQLVIGLTIVAFGTSAPEAAVSISAALKGSTGIAIGNIIGSNIFNILIILGIASCISTLAVNRLTVRYEIPFVILTSIVLVAIGAFFGELNFIAGIILWVLFLIFMFYLYKVVKTSPAPETDEESFRHDSLIKSILFTVLGLIAIVAGSYIAVDSASNIARFLGVTERIIGLTIVAFGTSLPELMTSVAAARKNKADIAIGNIVGSNIFNILFVLGTTALIKTVPYSSNFVIDGIVCIFAAVLLYIGVFKNHKLTRRTGIIMLICYAIYFIYLLL
ncbi:MAG: calcium/sodium antiporter [Lachnospiraceae bacterium]